MTGTTGASLGGDSPVTQRVPFVALDRQHASLRAELRDAFERVVGASSFILGEEVERFEEEFAAYCGVRHCVGVGSGTAALTLALLAAGIGLGDEIIVPAHTFIASALAVRHAGATPVFCDVDPDTALIDLDAASSVVTDRSAGVLPVHLYGRACDMDRVQAFAERHGLAVFEDAAQAHGASYGNRRVGGFGTAGGFSFYPSKNLGALGDGGAICTSDSELAERARQLRHLGQRRKGEHELMGFNERLDGLQAALLRVKLPYLDEWNEARRKHADAYRERLPSQLSCLQEQPESACIYHLFPVRTTDRDELAGRLAAAGIESGVHYSPCVPDQPAFARADKSQRRGGAYSAARAWATEELSLPMFESLRPDEIERVSVACHDALTPG